MLKNSPISEYLVYKQTKNLRKLFIYYVEFIYLCIYLSMALQKSKKKYQYNPKYTIKNISLFGSWLYFFNFKIFCCYVPKNYYTETGQKKYYKILC